MCWLSSGSLGSDAPASGSRGNNPLALRLNQHVTLQLSHVPTAAASPQLTRQVRSQYLHELSAVLPFFVQYRCKIGQLAAPNPA